MTRYHRNKTRDHRLKKVLYRRRREELRQLPLDDELLNNKPQRPGSNHLGLNPLQPLWAEDNLRKGDELGYMPK